MITNTIVDKLNKAEKMFLYYICNTATLALGYEAPLEYIKLLRPKIVITRLEEMKATIKPKFIPIINKLQKKLSLAV